MLRPLSFFLTLSLSERDARGVELFVRTQRSLCLQRLYMPPASAVSLPQRADFRPDPQDVQNPYPSIVDRWPLLPLARAIVPTSREFRWPGTPMPRRYPNRPRRRASIST